MAKGQRYIFATAKGLITPPRALIHCRYATLTNAEMNIHASDHAESEPAAPRSAEEWVESWIELLGIFKADAELSGDLAELLETLSFTPQLLQTYPLMNLARWQAASSLLRDRISRLDGEVRRMENQPIRKALPKLREQDYYDELLGAVSLEDDSMTERVLAGDISPPTPSPDKPLSNDEWMNRVVKNMNELNKSPRLVDFLSKRGF